MHSFTHRCCRCRCRCEPREFHVRIPALLLLLFFCCCSSHMPSCIWWLMVIGKKELFALIFRSFVKVGDGKIKNEFQKQSKMKLEWQRQQKQQCESPRISVTPVKIVQHEKHFHIFCFSSFGYSVYRNTTSAVGQKGQLLVAGAAAAVVVVFSSLVSLWYLLCYCYCSVVLLFFGCVSAIRCWSFDDVDAPITQCSGSHKWSV